MNINTRNIFNALFEFRPRGKFTPEENFLTEAFGYVLGATQKQLHSFRSLFWL